MHMRYRLDLALGCAVLAVLAWQSSAQQGARHPFPLPHRGRDSNAKQVAAARRGDQGRSTCRPGNTAAPSTRAGNEDLESGKD